MNYYNDNDPFACQWLEYLVNAGELPIGFIDNRSIHNAENLNAYRQCHFFAGIGGWPLALKLAGWPDNRPVWTGSCPCQPFSVAGKGKGVNDERHLWPEFRRLIAEYRPPVVFGEQVASSEVVGTQLEADFVVAVRGGDFARANNLAKRLAQSKSFHYWARWVDRVHADLEAEGYAFRYKVLGAHSVGAPHIRQRLFWVADAERPEPWLRDGQERETEVGRDRPAIDGDACRLADMQRERHERAESTRGASSGVRQRSSECSQTGRVGEPDRAGSQQGRTSTSPTGHRGPTKPDGCGLGNTDSSESPQPKEQPAWEELATTPGASRHVVYCRDGKLRRIPDPESGIQPLAHGIPRKLGPPLTGMGQVEIRAARANRVGRLRGYGNAIVPRLAAVFIKAYMESQ